jgi:hypothetical protein
MSKGTVFLGVKNLGGENTMIKKIVFAVGVVLGFIMLSLGNMCAGQRTAVPDTPIFRGHQGDLIVLDPQLLPWWPFGGHFRLTIKIKSIGENTSPAPFYDSFIWDLGQESEQLLHSEHLHQDDIDPVEVDIYYIYFWAPDEGEHTITICTDSHHDPELDNLVFEEKENNNCLTEEYYFWWIG